MCPMSARRMHVFARLILVLGAPIYRQVRCSDDRSWAGVEVVSGDAASSHGAGCSGACK